jgi:hypothetical protein
MNTPDPVAAARLDFELTLDEARIAASRAALRGALAGGLTANHLAPLAAFVLAMVFTAILAWTSLISRRHGEIALLLAAAAFMMHRLWTRRRFAIARRESAASIEALRAAGPVVLAVDEEGLTLSGATTSARWKFSDGLEAEDAGGLVYLWPRAGAPAVLPSRAFPSPQAASEFVALAKACISRASRGEDGQTVSRLRPSRRKL